MTAHKLVARGFGRLEAPTVLSADRLLVSDVTRGGVYEVDLSNGERRTIVPHRKGVGGLCRHAQGLVVTGRNVSLRRNDGTSETLMEPDASRGVKGFNDVAVDKAGRIFVGALCFRVADGWDSAKPGILYRIDLDGSVGIVDDDLLLPNGMAFSPDERTFYQSDSLRRVVWSYPVDSAGRFGARKLFANIPEGLTDGMAVAQDGSLLVAVAYAGLVLWFEPDGRLRERMEFASPMVTSVCFSVDRPSPALFVTTGPEDADPQLGGAIFELPAAVHGAVKHVARVVPRPTAA